MVIYTVTSHWCVVTLSMHYCVQIKTSKLLFSSPHPLLLRVDLWQFLEGRIIEYDLLVKTVKLFRENEIIDWDLLIIKKV